MSLRHQRRSPGVTSVPRTTKAWLAEIAAAYADAHETIAFGPVMGTNTTREDLFHMAPSVCLKFRGIRSSKKSLKRATDAALASYVAMTSREPESLSSPPMAFAFCYLAAHFGLDLVTEEVTSRMLDYIAGHQKQLARRIAATVEGR